MLIKLLNKIFFTAILTVVFTGFESKLNYLNSNFSYSIAIFGTVLICLYFVWLYIRKTEIFALVIYEVLAVLPIVALYLASGTSLRILLIAISANILIYIVAKLFVSKPIRLFRMRELSLNYLLMISIGYLLVISVVLGFNFDLDLLLLRDVYDRRFAVEDRYNTFILYSSSFMSKFVLPISLLRSLQKKKYIVALVVILLFVWFFLTTSLKTVLFTPIVIIALFYARKTKRLEIETLMIFGLSLLLIGEYVLLDGILLSRRLFYIPSILNNYYFDFFQGNSQYLSYGWYNPFLNYGYELSPNRLIASVYWGDSGTSANNGLVSSGFMNFGVLGVYFYSILFGLVIAQFPNRIQRKFAGVFVLMVFAFTTSFFITSMLSHGILLFLLLNRALLRRV